MRATKVIVACLCFAVVSAWALGSKGATKPEPENPFKGKFISVNVMAREPTSHQLSDVVVQDVGGRSFLVGTSTHKEEDFWAGGARIWVATNTLSEIMECDSIDEHRRRVAKFIPADKKAGGMLR